MKKSEKLSLIIITKNEARNIRNCIHSASGLVDEIIVFDSGSTDGTQQICREMGASVYETDWPGFGVQKNRALEKATGNWVLSLDADEQLSQELKNEIEKILSIDSDAADSYSIPRKSSYCGQFMKHSGWWPDRVVRLFKKSSGRFSDDIVHEKFISPGKTGRLNSPIIHHAITSVEQSIQKMNAYSTAGAERIFARGERTSVTRAVLKGLWSFLRTYILRLGILDGRMGLILAIANAEGTYYRHIKLWLKQRGEHGADKT
ncbi:MAG: glycosyltransferase family 2 protein [Pseudomonadota bacterium]